MTPAVKRIHRTSKEEMETTITFNRYEGKAELCTADPAVMRRWKRVGWPVEVLGRYPDGKPCTWQTEVPWKAAVRFLRLDALERARRRPGDASRLPRKRENRPNG